MDINSIYFLNNFPKLPYKTSLMANDSMIFLLFSN